MQAIFYGITHTLAKSNSQPWPSIRNYLFVAHTAVLHTNCGQTLIAIMAECANKGIGLAGQCLRCILKIKIGREIPFEAESKDTLFTSLK